MIPIKNIYYMLSYAFQILNEQGYKDMALEEFENVGDLCAAILAKGMSVQLKRGLNKAYKEKTETLNTLRGKISIAEMVKSQSLQRRQLVCTYDEFNENSNLNRIIKTTMLELMHQNIRPERKRELKKVLVFLDGIDKLDLKRINWNIRYNQNNQSYRMLIGICYLVVKGLLQTNEDGTVYMMDFLSDEQMSALYERFLREYYRKEFPQVIVSASKIGWALDDGFTAEMLPEMRTDVTLEYRNRVLIIDAKYYGKNLQEHHGKKSILSANLYQIHTYVTQKAEERDYDAVSGLLLYARTDVDVQPDMTTSTKGHKLGARTLDLNREFKEISIQMNGFVNEFLML